MRYGSGHTEELFIIQIKGFIKTSSSKGPTIPKRMNFHKIAWEGGGSYAHKLCFANDNLLPTISIFFSKNLAGGRGARVIRNFLKKIIHFGFARHPHYLMSLSRLWLKQLHTHQCQFGIYLTNIGNIDKCNE